MDYILLKEAIHPNTGELYKIGDNVVIYQGRFGHNNIIKLNTMFKVKNDPQNYVYVTETIYKDEEWEKKWPNCPQGTFLNSVKRKISDKELKALNKAKQLVSQYHDIY